MPSMAATTTQPTVGTTSPVIPSSKAKSRQRKITIPTSALVEDRSLRSFAAAFISALRRLTSASRIFAWSILSYTTLREPSSTRYVAPQKLQVTTLIPSL